MIVRYMSCLWLLIAFGQTLFAQCPPPGFPQPGNSCPTAPILCENLDGYCATINNSNVVQSFPGCPGWQLNNDEWFAFFAGTTSITIQVTPLNCTQGGGMQVGLQGGIYAGCGPPWVPMDLQCACTEDPFILTSNNFVVGQIYWIVLDGCAGNVCDYNIDVLDGSTVGQPPADPGSISGPAMICAGMSANYSIAPVALATNYSWTLSPAATGSITGANNNAVVNWDNAASGTAEICVAVSNGCYTNPNPSCTTVEVAQVPTATISGSGFVCPGIDTPVDLNIDFTGEIPWEFVYTLDGIIQPPVQTSDNPFILTVNQAGIYALQSVVSIAPGCPDSGMVSGSAEVIASNLAGPDWVLTIDGISCDSGAMNLHYTLCNTGATATADNLPITFYLGNPLENTVQVLGTSFIDAIFVSGDCRSYTLPGINASWFPNGVSSGLEIHGVVNDAAALPTPYTLDSFPLTNVLECDYANNLSFTELVLDSLTLELGPDIIVCSDSSVTFNAGPDFYSYLWQDSSTLSTFTALEPGLIWVEVTDACGFKLRDSVFFSFSQVADTQFPDVAICPGLSRTFSAPGFDTYIWAPAAGLSCTDCPDVTAMPAVTTEYTLFASDSMGCVLRDTFVVTVLPEPTKTVVVEFCPGASVVIGGVTYTQPGTVLSTISATVGCDTVVTYQIQYVPLPQPSILSIICPPNQTIIVPPNVLSTVVSYDDPQASTDCPCGDASVQFIQGLPSGVIFPVGSTTICYRASDSCGATKDCCFTVTLANEPEDDPCDVKNIGCLKFEILAIFQNPAKQRTYRMRVTNSCQNKLSYVAFQLPDGIVADKPVSASNYTAPSGRQYLVRNPNYSPFYSIRFKSLTDSIAGGQSDIFEYTLPPQAEPTFIHAIARLEPQVYYEAHQNVFACVVQQTPNRPEDRQTPESVLQKVVQVFPNPASELLFVDLAAWENERLRLKVTDALGRTLLTREIIVGSSPEALLLPKHWNTGMYQLEVFPAGAAPQTLRFVLKR